MSKLQEMKQHLIGITKLTDDDPMTFGQHKGTPMKNVPASYLMWLERQDWISKYPNVKQYIDENWDAIKMEVE